MLDQTPGYGELQKPGLGWAPRAALPHGVCLLSAMAASAFPFVGSDTRALTRLLIVASAGPPSDVRG